MNLGNLKVIFLFILFLFIFPPINAKPIEGFEVEILILDKITFKNPPEYVPENFVLLKIYDKQNLLDDYLIYQGWMISSSPAVTPLEHPIYDLWLKDCKVSIDF